MERTGKFQSLFYVNNWLKTFLILTILVLPFQRLPRIFMEETDASALGRLRYIDEMAFLISLVILLAFILVNPLSYRIKLLPFTKFIVIFLLAAFVSLFLNSVPALQGVFGTYDVLKNILVIYVFSHLKFSREDFLKVVGMLGKLAIVIGAAAIIAEIAAMTWGVGIGTIVREEKRLGLYRVASLTGLGSEGHLAVFMSLIFYMTTATRKASWEKKGTIFASLSTIFLALSRQAWVGFGLMTCFMKRKLLPVGSLIILVAIWMVLGNIESLNPDNYFRGFAFMESLRVLKENFFLGAGPGMFGGLAASIFETPYYDDWPAHFRDFALRVNGIDLFWPWMWGEFGIIGFLAYLSIFASIFLYIRNIGRFFQRRRDKVMYEAGKVLRYFMLALGVMGFASGLNAAFVVFTYFGLVGMYVSAYYTARETIER